MDSEDPRMSSRWLVTLAMLLDMTLPAAGWAADSKPLDPHQVYAKQATWAETMIATRANCAAWAKDQKEGQVASTPLAAVWAKIQADWPTHAAWFRQDLPGVRYLDWFLQANNNPHFERWILGRALPRVAGTDTGLSQELDELARATCRPAIRGGWNCMPGRAASRTSSSAGPPDLAGRPARANSSGRRRNWSARKRLRAIRAGSPCRTGAARCADARQGGARGEDRGAASAIELLAAALPGRFSASRALTKQLADAKPKWSGVLAAVLKQDAAALAALPALADEIRAVRRSLLRSLAGMAEFLDQQPGVSLETEWEEQFAALANDLDNRAWFDQVAPQTLRPESLIQPGDRDPADVVLRRTAALLADVKRLGGADLAEAERHLAALAEGRRGHRPGARRGPVRALCRRLPPAPADRLPQSAAGLPRAAVRQAPPGDLPAHVRSVLRHRRHARRRAVRAVGPVRTAPQLRDVLADSVVRSGRLAGQKLSGGPNKVWRIAYDGMGNLSGEETVGGSFLSPDLSYDGRSIVFAYVECTGDRHHAHHTDPSRGHWAEGRCYHVFQVNVDGSNLVQLTDGTWNDFDPRWLPSGRIAFVSERRGGYLRCGRVCPTYTLYDMAADGGDIRCLSPHETNEWHPSVTHDGRIAWTRWDYVDRHFSAAHMPWITTADGRDPRPIHGNYAWRGSRPDMELNLRAIPDSPKFVATAAPHHGQAFGSLVIIDPRVRRRRRRLAAEAADARRRFPRDGRRRHGDLRQRLAVERRLSPVRLRRRHATAVPERPGAVLRQRQLRHLPGRRVRQPGTGLPRSGHLLSPAHSASSAAEAAGRDGELRSVWPAPARPRPRWP